MAHNLWVNEEICSDLTRDKSQASLAKLSTFIHSLTIHERDFQGVGERQKCLIKTAVWVSIFLMFISNITRLIAKILKYSNVMSEKLMAARFFIKHSYLSPPLKNHPHVWFCDYFQEISANFDSSRFIGRQPKKCYQISLSTNEMGALSVN